MIDIVITACRRHEILEQTLTSFKKNLFKDYPIRMFVNVDPVGPDKDHLECIMDVCHIVFPQIEILFKAPDTPNFSAAFKWTWDNVISEFAFHLEDDWKLLHEVNLQDMIDMLTRHENLALLRLPQFKSTENQMKNWDKFFPWNGEYFECPEELKMSTGFCGHPSLIKGEFVRNIAPYIDITRNPEKQFHHGPKEIMGEVAKWSYGVYGKPNSPPAIQDLGRKWLLATGWQKKGSKAFFMEWEKKGV